MKEVGDLNETTLVQENVSVSLRCVVICWKTIIGDLMSCVVFITMISVKT